MAGQIEFSEVGQMAIKQVAVHMVRVENTRGDVFIFRDFNDSWILDSVQWAGGSPPDEQDHFLLEATDAAEAAHPLTQSDASSPTST